MSSEYAESMEALGRTHDSCAPINFKVELLADSTCFSPFLSSLPCFWPLPQTTAKNVLLRSQNAPFERNKNQQGHYLHEGPLDRCIKRECLDNRGQIKSAGACQEYQPDFGSGCRCCPICVSTDLYACEDRTLFARQYALSRGRGLRAVVALRRAIVLLSQSRSKIASIWTAMHALSSHGFCLSVEC